MRRLVREMRMLFDMACSTWVRFCKRLFTFFVIALLRNKPSTFMYPRWPYAAFYNRMFFVFFG